MLMGGGGVHHILRLSFSISYAFKYSYFVDTPKDTPIFSVLLRLTLNFSTKVESSRPEKAVVYTSR
jgi:hypothetical protein